MVNLAELNDQQQLAAKTIDGPVLILAGAGSGKTRTITFRMAYMVQALGIAPESILAVSFTNKAAGEIKERVAKFAGKFPANKMTLCTFHSLCLIILKNEITLLGYRPKFSLYDQADQMSLIRMALKNYEAGKNFDRNQLQQKLSFLKNRGISYDQFIHSEYFDENDPYDICLEHVYTFYQEKLHFFNALDFDDLLLLTVKLFDQFPDKAMEYSKRFQYIMIDEYQDTNSLQFSLVLHLTKSHKNLCVVGDDDQSIYSWRGANVSHILEFEKHFPNAKIIKLEQNYRSTTSILDLANKIIVQNKKRRDKTLFSDMVGGVKPVLWKCSNIDQQANAIADQIWKWYRNHYHLSQVAIIYRSNIQSQEIEDAIRLANIPYKMIGGIKFYEKKEIKDLISYLSLIYNVYDEMALRRIINVPPRGVGAKTLQDYVDLSNEKKLPIFKLMEDEHLHSAKREMSLKAFCHFIREMKIFFENNPLDVSISYLIEQISFKDFIEKSYNSAKDVKRRLNDVEQFLASTRRFMEKMDLRSDENKRRTKNKSLLKIYLERLLLVDSQDRSSDIEGAEEIKKDEVTLMTLHSSKGLEFERVFLVGVEEDILPHKKSIESSDSIEEERRLFYVGITRAKTELIMTYCKEKNSYGKLIPRHKSRFLFGIDKNLWRETDLSSFEGMDEEQKNQFQDDFFKNIIEKMQSNL